MINNGEVSGVVEATEQPIQGDINSTRSLSGEVQQSSGVGGVKDVQVNDVSVVDANKVAHIDLTPYAEKEDVYDKQTIDTALEGKADTDDIPTDLSDLQGDSDHRLVTDAEKSEWSGKADTSDIPTDLADLSDDATHRLVTDTEKSTWDNKADVSDIPTVNNPTITIQKNGQNVDTFSLNQTTDKVIDISVPTKTSDLQNDSSFITNTVNNLANYYLKSQTYTQAEVDALIDAAVNGRFQKVNILPATGEPNIIYLVPKATPETSNACDEYIWQDNAWELIGSTDIDLSGYVTDEDLGIALADYLTISAFNTAIANYYTKTEVGNLLDGKVDKETGKGLSTNDYDNTAKGIVDSVTTNLATKADKVSGATNGNLAGLNGSGNLTDSGIAANNVVKKSGDTMTGNLAIVSPQNTIKYLSLQSDTKENVGRATTFIQKNASASVDNGTYLIDLGWGESTKRTSLTIRDAAGLTDKLNLKVKDSNGTETNYKVFGEHNSNAYDNTDKAKVGKIDETTTSISGNPISISGLKANQLAKNPIITLEPIQDLHGQSKPYPAGGGKNKLPMTVNGIKAVNTAGTWSGNTYTHNNVTFTIVTDNGNNVVGIRANNKANANTQFYLWFNTLTVTSGTYTLSGCPAGGDTSTTYSVRAYIDNDSDHFDDVGDGVNLSVTSNISRALIIIRSGYTASNLMFYPQIESGSSKTPFAPYENICPISGYDKIEVLSCGRNLIPYPYVNTSKTQNQVTFTVNSDGSISLSGTATADASLVLMSVEDNRYSGYRLTGGISNAIYIRQRITDKNGTYIRATSDFGSGATIDSINPNTEKYNLLVWVASGTNCSGKNVYPMIQLESGASDTYEPYDKTTDLSESLGQTVYGGSLDVRSGIFTKIWGYIASYAGETLPSEWISDRDEYVSGTTPTTGAEVAYKLASANYTTIQLTPHEISLLMDYAYVSTNGTNIALDYHNGELASLSDVAQLSETVERLTEYIKGLINNA